MAAEYDAELWIGAPEWPAESKIDSLFGIEPWDGLAFDEFQIGGIYCHHQKFFGLKFEVPYDDPATLLAEQYYSSHLPGSWNPDYATPLEDILKLREQLKELDLELDPVHYAKFAEGYLPVTAESAWEYAISKELSLFEHSHKSIFDRVRDLLHIGLGDTFADANEYLKAYWDYFEKKRDSKRPFSGVPDRWTAVIV